MTIAELHIQLDLNADDKISVLNRYAKIFSIGYFFIDSEDGQCYLFDEQGDLDDVNKIKTISEDCIKTGIKKIVIPDNVTSIGGYAFSYCRELTNVTIGNGVTSIADGAFQRCSGLKSVMIPNNVTNIGRYAFSDCSRLTSMTIPDNVTNIGDGAFYNCANLTSVMISNGVTSIGANVFYHCYNLKSLIFKDKTLDEVKSMKYYPWGIEDESIIKVES